MGVLKTTTIIVIIGTALVDSYYTLFPYLEKQAPEESVNESLAELEAGLTYEKFVNMKDQQKMMDLAQDMPQSTRELVIKEAKSRNKAATETVENFLAKTDSATPEDPKNIRYLMGAELKGVKGHKANGHVWIISSQGVKFLRLDGFSMTNGPALHVYLTKSGDVSTGIDLGRLKANSGSQNYKIPDDTSVSAYRNVVIYSKPFDIYYATAQLTTTVNPP